MKDIFWSGVILAWLCASYSQANILGQDGSPPVIAEMGPHHRVWKWTSYSTNRLGRAIPQEHSYTELETGMYYLENGQWHESKAEIEIHPNKGAVAAKGQHKVIFSPDLKDPVGTVDLLSFDNKRFRSSILGLSYYDTATGENVLIAEAKSSIGLLSPPNQVIYPDAFTDVKADVRYTYTKGGLEQDVIFLEQIPSPADYGLNEETTKLQVLTEFFEPPVARKTRVNKKGAETDTVIDFGEMRIVPGQAFMVDNGIKESKTVPVDKQWQKLEGRDFLIEEVDCKVIKDHLDKLPLRPVAFKPQVLPNSPLHKVAKMLLLPAKKEAKGVPAKSQEMKVAGVQYPKAFVLDYIILSGQSGFTFKGDTTYLVTNAVNLTGTTTFEGGAVIKFTNNTVAKISVEAVNCETGPYRPFVLTSMHDDSVGELISGSTSNPWTNYCGDVGLYISVLSENDFVLKNVRFSHLNTALFIDYVYTLVVQNFQSVNCNTFLNGWTGDYFLLNGLIYKCSTVFDSSSDYIYPANVTFHICNNLNANAPSVYLTNCLLVSVTNMSVGNIFQDHSVEILNDTGIFQTIGAAGHYLSADSPYRNIGTTSINASLLADLKKKTTYPPIILDANNILRDMVLYPQAQRDKDAPNIGYHYDPLDYAIKRLEFYGPNYLGYINSLTLTNGVALAFYGKTNDAIMMADGTTFISEGNPTNLNRMVWYNTVQEQATTNWSSATPGKFILGDPILPPLAYVQCRFTEFSRLSKPGYSQYLTEGGSGTGLLGTFQFQDCQFLGGYLECIGPGGCEGAGAANFYITNCVFERTQVGFYPNASDNLVAYGFNNLFWNNNVLFGTNSALYSYTFKDNLFDKTIITQNGVTISHDYNGYLTGQNRLSPNGANDVILNSHSYQSGSLGKFYYSGASSLINAGSRNATNAALYHYTTTTDNAKETNSVVDIGFHYVAADGNAAAKDQDGDRFSDVFEDRNGNGTVESGETDWQSATDVGLKVKITRPRENSILP